MKRDDALMNAAPRNLRNITLSERSQTQNTACCVMPFTWNVQNRQVCREKRRSVVAGAGGREEWGVTVNGYGPSFWGEESVLQLDGGDQCTAL